MKYQTILETIGNTPVVELPSFSPHAGVKILAKLEGSNPGGSIKDRIALYLIEDAEKKGLIKKDTILLEATSGNTGIGLAMVAAVKGYKFMAVMPESASLERRQILKQFGAEIVLTDGARGTNYAIEIAHQMLAEDKRYLMLDQFANEANVLSHYETTGKEIVEQVPDITHFVAGMGTGGTLMGVGRKLKESKPTVMVIGIEPPAGSTIQGLRNMAAYTPPIYHPELLDGELNVKDDEAFALAREVYKREGISVGISSGAALWGAITVAKKIKSGTVVTIFPDRGDRYVSTSLFAKSEGK